MAPIYADYFTDQSATFAETIDLKTDTSTSTFVGQIRKSYTSSEYVDFIVTVVPDDTRIVISLDATQTRSMRPYRYVFDVFEITSDGSSIKRVTGTLEVSPSATRL